MFSLRLKYTYTQGKKLRWIVSSLAVPGNVLLRMSGVATRTVNKSENGRHFFFRPVAELPRAIFRRGELILMGKSSSTGVWGRSPHEGKGKHATLINGPVNWRLSDLPLNFKVIEA